VIRRLTCALLLIAVLGACSRPSDETAMGPRVAIVADQSLPDERQVVAPGVLAARMALRDAGLEPVDVPPAAAASLAADGSVVAALVMPFTHVPTDVWDAWSATGMPVVSLNALAPPTPGVRQLVPSAADAARAMEAAGAGEGSCVVAGEDAWSSAYATSMLASSPGWRPATTTEGCSTVIWSGSAADAPAPSETPLLLTDRARTTPYLRAHGPAAGTPLGTCGCVDPASDAGVALQSFVHAYQAGTGLDPGPYAAEAYDAAALLVAAWRDVGADRAAIGAAIAATERYEGVAGPYRWDGATLLAPASRLYRAVGWRWVAV
jgi:hypothetical protein